MKKNKKPWYQYLWIFTVAYTILGFFNILFGWLGMICFILPVIIAILGGDKTYCNKYCGRSWLFDLLGNKCHLSRKKDIPAFIRSKWFRYGFLVFFMAMFANMVYLTYTVFAGANEMREVVTLLWSVKVFWHWAAPSAAIAPWIVQYAYGFYSLMLTSIILGLLTMFLFKPRSWCVYCPMGTMTQMICQAKNK